MSNYCQLFHFHSIHFPEPALIQEEPNLVADPGPRFRPDRVNKDPFECLCFDVFRCESVTVSEHDTPLPAEVEDRQLPQPLRGGHPGTRRTSFVCSDFPSVHILVAFFNSSLFYAFCVSQNLNTHTQPQPTAGQPFIQEWPQPKGGTGGGCSPEGGGRFRDTQEIGGKLTLKITTKTAIE